MERPLDAVAAVLETDVHGSPVEACGVPIGFTVVDTTAIMERNLTKQQRKRVPQCARYKAVW